MYSDSRLFFVCVTTMCGGINMDINKVTTSSRGPKNTATRCPQLPLLWDFLSYPIHSFMLWLSQLHNKGFGWFSTEKTQNRCQNVPLHNWLHLRGLCMLKCYTQKCNLHTLVWLNIKCSSCCLLVNDTKLAPKTSHSHLNMWQTQVSNYFHLCLL